MPDGCFLRVAGRAIFEAGCLVECFGVQGQDRVRYPRAVAGTGATAIMISRHHTLFHRKNRILNNE